MQGLTESCWEQMEVKAETLSFKTAFLGKIKKREIRKGEGKCHSRDAWQSAIFRTFCCFYMFWGGGKWGIVDGWKWREGGQLGGHKHSEWIQLHISPSNIERFFIYLSYIIKYLYLFNRWEKLLIFKHSSPPFSDPSEALPPTSQTRITMETNTNKEERENGRIECVRFFTAEAKQT